MPDPAAMEELGAKLAEIAGTKPHKLRATAEQLASWNEALSAGTEGVFEHRVLLGIAIESLRPKHGTVMEYHSELAGQLVRSERWLRETVRVSSAVRKALRDGVAIPLEIAEIGWADVPKAIVNLRNGRPLRWVEPKEPNEPSDEDRETAVAGALAMLVGALEAVEDPTRRGELVAEAVERLRGMVDHPAEVDDPDEPDGGDEREGSYSGRRDQPPSFDPGRGRSPVVVPDKPDEPTRPDGLGEGRGGRRHRPGRRPGRQRR